MGKYFGWWNEYKKSKMGVFGLGLAVITIVIIVIGPYIAPIDPMLRNADIAWQAPSWSHLLGTNNQGQDVLSRLFWAGKTSLFIGMVTAIIITTVGTSLGLIAGYFGGIADELLMRLADIMLILPRLPLLIVLAAYLQGGGAWTIIMLLAMTGWSGTARQVRAQALSCKQRSFVEASKAAGAGGPHVIVQHILPNVAGIVIANFVMEIVVVILIESSLSFLRLTDPTVPTWGLMLSKAQTSMAFTAKAWWWFVPPGAAIAILGIAFAFIGNTINDKFVLRLRDRKS